MKITKGFYSVYIMLIMLSCSSNDKIRLKENQFVEIAEGIAKGWNEGNARSASAFFSDNAVYEEPPKKQFYKSRDSLFAFFGGEKGFDKPMKMTWHNLAFNKKRQIGFGEYTFALNSQYHGIAVIKFEGGKIIRWREYQYKSDSNWKDFTGESNFDDD
jgi:SnoaL-like domain